MRGKNLLAVMAAALLLASVIGDRFLFQFLIYKFPNYSSWDSFRWYNFEYQLRYLTDQYGGDGGPHQTANQPAPRKPLVLIVGSSIAQYSVQKDLLELELNRIGCAADVHMLVHASMLPLDLRHYSPRIQRIRPDLIVYITNPADLELERYLPPWEAGPVYDEVSESHYMTIRHPMLVFYPGAYALENPDLGLEKRLGLGLRALFSGLRMRHEWLDPLRFSWRVRSGPLKSYLNYQGLPVPEGLWREGNSGACFTLPGHLAEGIFEVPPALAAQPDFSITVSGADVARGRDSAVCAASVRPLLVLSRLRAGWQPLLTKESAPSSRPPFLRFSLSHVISPQGDVIRVRDGSAVHTGRGLRLPGNLGVKWPGEREYFIRRRSLEDERIRTMTETEYARDFERRTQPDDWMKPERIALRQLNMLRLSKYYTRWIDFSDIFQARELRRFANEQAGRLLIVNNPEHPDTRAEYRDTAWYGGYLSFLKGLERDGVSFRDESGRGGIRFTDAHHLTYDGMVSMGPIYAGHIARALSTPDRGP